MTNDRRLHALAVLLSLVIPASGAAGQTLSGTYVGGNGGDQIRDVSFDSTGNLYVTGGVGSSNFSPTIGPAFDTGNIDGASFGATDVVIAKYDPSGTLLWSRLLGGPGYDRAYAVEALDDGCIVAGRAGRQFPVTSGVVQESFGGDDDVNTGYGPQDAFAARLDGAGNVVWATYVGGPGRELARDLAVDGAGRAYLALTAVNQLPHVTAGAFDTTDPAIATNDEVGAVVRLSADGTTVEWATYLGGTSYRGGGRGLGNPSIRVGNDGTVYVLGYGDADDHPTTAGSYQPTFSGMSDLSLTALSADGSRVLWSTYLGGSGFEGLETHSLAVRGDRLVVASGTNSTDIPLTAGAFDATHNGGGDVFVALFRTDGTHLASTVVGGSSNEHGEGVDFLSTGEIALSGRSSARPFPTTDSTWEGGNTRDGHLTILSADLTQHVFGARIGGATSSGQDLDELRSVEVGPGDVIAIGGQASTRDFASASGSFGGRLDGVVMWLTLDRPPPPLDGGMPDGGAALDAGITGGDGGAGGDAGPGGSSDGGDGTVDAGVGDEDGGCSCRLGARRDTSRLTVVWLMLGALLLARRRRRLSARARAAR